MRTGLVGRTTGAPQRLLPRARPAADTATDSPLAAAVRWSLLALAAALALATGGAVLSWTAAVVAVAALGAVLPARPRVRATLLALETALGAAGAAVLGLDVPALLAAVSSGALAGGLAAGYGGAVLSGGAAATALLTAGLVLPGPPFAALTLVLWLLVPVLTAVLGARIHVLTVPQGEAERYAEASRLLQELRSVTHGLSGSLDPGLVARSLLERCLHQAPCRHGAVLLDVAGDHLVPLALHGAQRPAWSADLTRDGPVQRAWLTGTRVLDRREGEGEDSLLALPVTAAGRRLAVVLLTAPAEVLEQAGDALARLVDEAALPLESAVLFDELRTRAAHEERARVAREMHDGVAQDLAYLGYELDRLVRLQREAPEQLEAAVRALREQLTATMSDLRMSISDLRASVGPARGLGAALSEYARRAGTSSRLTVHLRLAEGSTRLSAAVEVQVLRVAHEAVARAQQAAGARNLWVDLDVDPPGVRLVVEDDAPAPAAVGVQGAVTWTPELGEDAALTVEPRLPTGTRTTLTIRGARL